nr:uncharacterized protein CTRU02_13232 [Colletotrichum truncatum]KAF6783724.1 hypothetical protein CTRU02_13232 [Colletotrichum truncatum]
MAGLQGLEESGIRAFFCPSMTDDQYDDAEKGDLAHEARLAHVDALHRDNAAKASQLVRIGMSISHPGSVPFDETDAKIKFANQRGIFCCSHSGPIKSSVLSSGVMERADHGLMFPGHLYIHCTNLTDQELSLIGESGDLFGQMRLGLQLQQCLDSKVSHDDGKVVMKLDLTVRDAMIWATRNGVAALRLESEIGTLTPGKRADVVYVSDDRALTPSMNPMGTTVF